MKTTTRSLSNSSPRVAVIGAGISGLICARTLIDQGVRVNVFEKSRGTGGRMATRRTEDGLRFDHGAQYFTVRDEQFQRYVESWQQDGIVAPWNGRICTLTDSQIEWKDRNTPRYVAVPGMNAICKHLAIGLDIKYRCKLQPPLRIDGVWQLTDESGELLDEFDCVITSAPAAQSAELLKASRELSQRAAATKMSGCWAAMLAFDKPTELSFDGAFVHNSPLSWIARNSNKPERGDRETWVLHASPDWTDQHIDEDANVVQRKLIDALSAATRSALPTPIWSACHRWRYAIPLEPLEDRCLFDETLRLGACGDWCNGPRVEGAFLSGLAIADRVLSHFA